MLVALTDIITGTDKQGQYSVAYHPEDRYTMMEDHTFIAQWKKNKKILSLFGMVSVILLCRRKENR